ncbi:MAG: response regulator [Bryobacterales bacterium]|nr:response regulator [Bryobacterales bacterium]
MVFCAAALMLAIALDAARPFDRNYSIFYLLPTIYAGWALRGRIELAIYAAAIAAAFLVPYLRAPGQRSAGITFNRVMGVVVGCTVVAIMWERRRYSDALRRATVDLENRVAARTAELQSLNDEYRRVIDDKTQFLSNLSHEIRTPLHGLLGATSLLADSPPGQEQQDLVHTMRLSGEALLSLVNDVLDLSRIDAGRLEMDPLPFRVQSTVEEVAAILRVEAQRKGIELGTRISASVAPYLLGDRLRIRQILGNLVGNAVKFTEHGSITVQVACLESNGGEQLLHFSVEDTGIGIPAEIQPRLFGKFMQADTSTTRRHGGSGLGLAICKSLVELMHGSIGVRSRPGEGSRFWFTLRLPVAPQEAESGSIVPAAQPSRNRKALALVVEDNSVNQKLARRFLEKLGCEVEVASHGEEALHLIGNRSFDIIFMDCHMPVLDGFETARAIRQKEANSGRHTPIIAMTAGSMEGDREACLDAGMDDYLAKPVHVDKLHQALERWSLTTRLE